MKEEILEMRSKEVDRYDIIRRVIEGKIKQVEASEILGITTRQIRKIERRVKKEGVKGIIHRLRGCPSNRRFKNKIEEKIKNIIKEKYIDFGPTFANEKLKIKHNIKIGTETLRQLMIKEGYWKNRKMKEQHRDWRERKEHYGEMVQLDGSEHAWFEKRGKKKVLIKYVDDATSRFQYGVFVDSESTEELLRSIKEYIKRYGRPMSLYVDRDSVFKVNLNNRYVENGTTEKETQFTRAMSELGIRVIFASSPQAKGRIERSYRTDQDRLVKEMRLEEINEAEVGNKYLEDEYMDDYNIKFSREPKEKENFHRLLLREHDLDKILSIQVERLVKKDFTIQIDNNFYQLEAKQPVRVCSGIKVILEKRLDGIMRIRYKEKYLNYHNISKQPYKPKYAVYPKYITAYYKESVYSKHSNAVRI